MRFAPSLGQAPDGGHLGAGVRGGHGDERQPVSSAIALPRPIDEPPPTATQPSAPISRATSTARSATSTGHVHAGLGAAVPRTRGRRGESATAGAVSALLGAAQHQHPAQPEPVEPRRPSASPSAPAPKHDPHRLGLVGERLQALIGPPPGQDEIEWACRNGFGTPNSRAREGSSISGKSRTRLLLDPEDRVRVEVGLSATKMCVVTGGVPRGGDDEVDVRRAVGVPSGGARAGRRPGRRSGIG